MKRSIELRLKAIMAGRGLSRDGRASACVKVLLGTLGILVGALALMYVSCYPSSSSPSSVQQLHCCSCVCVSLRQGCSIPECGKWSVLTGPQYGIILVSSTLGLWSTTLSSCSSSLSLTGVLIIVPVDSYLGIMNSIFVPLRACACWS